MKADAGRSNMDPISNSDRLVMLLRQKLEERAKAQRAGARPQAQGAAPSQPSAVQAMAAAENADERSLRRTIIQNLLADQLDPALLNDAQFQQVVTRVNDAIADDRGASELMSRVIADIKSR
jgi:hypothetical protein